jgi:hypothetical protein
VFQITIGRLKETLKEEDSESETDQAFKESPRRVVKTLGKKLSGRDPEGASEGS